MIGEPSDIDLLGFVPGAKIREKWDAARQLMAERRMQAASGNAVFREAFLELKDEANAASGVNTLLALDLLVRIPDLVRREYIELKASILSQVLRHRPESLWSVVNAKDLPQEAKPAEIRENIASALMYASGSWVFDYAIEGLAREDRSQRCRLALADVIANINRSPHQWFQALDSQPWPTILTNERSTANSATRVRDIIEALRTAFHVHRISLEINPEIGKSIASFLANAVVVSRHKPLPANLAATGQEVTVLIEEILAADFTQVLEPTAYSPLENLNKWWHPLPYPNELKEALAFLVRTLQSAITFRARLGQKSESLVSRLGQALGPNVSVSPMLEQIANREGGLLPEIDDWLRGNVRSGSATANAVSALLSGTSSTQFIELFAPLMLDAMDLEDGLLLSRDDALLHDARRCASRINAIGAELRLSIAGAIGDAVEFNAYLHRTSDGTIPPEPDVRIVRPMVVRKRPDGADEIIERAIVSVKR